MPIYEYECQKCHKIIEHMQKISDPNLSICPECGGEVQKLISHSSFHLKGNGWYVTDYAGKKSSSQTTSEAPVPAKKEAASVPVSSAPSCSCGTSSGENP
jgi:putative FmdB family regulatory protein